MAAKKSSKTKIKQVADSIEKGVNQHQDKIGSLKDCITFNEYLQKVLQNPKICELSHARIYSMIMSHGVDEEGNYNFFKEELFGLEKPLKEVVDYFKSAACRLDTRKRIFLLLGPVSSAKSTLVDMIKSGMEQYSQTEEGALYGIEGCPMHEEPLHLIPPDMRESLYEKHGIYIEGDLCPRCSYVLNKVHDGDYSKMGIERVLFSEQNRLGIGTFLPSDPKSQDITELIGSINFSTVGEYGSESNPMAFTFDGEINIANRGVMEFIEMLKADEKFLYLLLTLTQEQVVKAPRFPRIYCDLAIMAHTNEAEYKEFINNPKSEALQDRIIKVEFPYNMRLDEENRIYRKLLSESKVEKHIAPHTIQSASMMAILSRLVADSNPRVDAVKKMRLYNGENISGFSESDIRKMREDAPEEGRFGISPRFIVNTIANAMIQDDMECLTPTQLLRMLKQGIAHFPRFSDDEKKQYIDLISVVNSEYEKMAEDAVKRAIVYSLEDSANDLFETYLANIEAYVNKQQVRDEFDNLRAVDETLMRKIEKRMNVQETGKDSFRSMILAKVGTSAVKGEKFTRHSEDPLRIAIDEIIYEENKGQIKSITTVNRPSEELQKKISTTIERLIDEQGYCPHCANELLKYVGAVFSRSPEDES